MSCVGHFIAWVGPEKGWCGFLEVSKDEKKVKSRECRLRHRGGGWAQAGKGQKNGRI